MGCWETGSYYFLVEKTWFLNSAASLVHRNTCFSRNLKSDLSGGLSWILATVLHYTEGGVTGRGAAHVWFWHPSFLWADWPPNPGLPVDIKEWKSVYCKCLSLLCKNFGLCFNFIWKNLLPWHSEDFPFYSSVTCTYFLHMSYFSGYFIADLMVCPLPHFSCQFCSVLCLPLSSPPFPGFLLFHCHSLYFSTSDFSPVSLPCSAT